MNKISSSSSSSSSPSHSDVTFFLRACANPKFPRFEEVVAILNTDEARRGLKEIQPIFLLCVF